MRRSSRALVALLMCSAGVTFMAKPAQAEDAGSAPRPTAANRHDVPKFVDRVPQVGLPGALCVFGNARAVLVNDSQDVVVACAEVGKGRVVVFGHEGYLGKPSKDKPNATLDAAVRWATRGKSGASDAGVRFGSLNNQDVGRTRCIVINAAAISAEDLAKYDDFIRDGGAVITGLPGWGWLQLNEGKSLANDLPANRLLARYGIVWLDGTAPAKKSSDGYDPALEPSKLVNADVALDYLERRASDGEMTDLQIAGDAVSAIAGALPDDEPTLLPRLRRLANADASGRVYPSAAHPLGPKQALDRVALTLQLQAMKKLDASGVQAHPASADFPGAVPADAERVSAHVAVPAKFQGWYSTGLYAAPGEAFVVQSNDLRSEHVMIRVGCHSDRLFHLAQWKRVPQVDMVVPMKNDGVSVASPFGGLIYVVFDKPASREVKLRIDHAVRAPTYVHGVTTVDAWHAEVRNRPAPWGEIVTDDVVITVPAEHLRKLNDPDNVAEFFVRMSAQANAFGSRPIDRPRAERFVADVQISAGYMHSGHPIMTHLDAAPRMVDSRLLTEKGEWGLFHELGHNHQRTDWTFEGTGEVTNNLWSLYLMEHMTGANEDAFHPSFTRAKQSQMIRDHIAAGAPYEKWKASPFLALAMYRQLQREFGWAPFTRVFGEYESLKPDERPKTDEQKRDQWMTRMSRATGRNLGPFFQRWGVPTSETARKSIADLPEWMPDELK